MDAGAASFRRHTKNSQSPVVGQFGFLNLRQGHFDLYATTRSERPQLEKFLMMLGDRRAMLLQQREDIDAVLEEIAVLDRDCRRRLKGDAPAATRAAKAVVPGG